MTSALAANLAYLYTLPLCTFFSSLYHNVVIQSTLLQHCDNTIYNKKSVKLYCVYKYILISIYSTKLLSVAVSKLIPLLYLAILSF